MNSRSTAFGTPSIAPPRWGCGLVSTSKSRLPAHAPARSRGVTMTVSGKRVLVVGGTRFSGLYLVHELCAQGAEVTVLNRGSRRVDNAGLAIPGESLDAFNARAGRTKQLIADRTDSRALREVMAGESFDVIFDNNGRERSDTVPLADIARNMSAHFVYMSSAGVYRKSPLMPHVEGDAVDEKSRHKGKLETEAYLRESGVTWTAIRPTYIYGAMNYNPLEQYFFERIEAGRPVCVPGHGLHITGLGHVRDLAKAMVACAGEEVAYGKVYNVQDVRSVTFDGVVELCAKAAGKPAPEIVHYEPGKFKFGKKKTFPFRPQHFFTSSYRALKELDWKIEYDLEKGLRDAYENDFLMKKAAGGLENDFEIDEKILSVVKGASVV